MHDPDDPRAWAAAASPAAATLHALARQSLGAATRQDSDRCDADLRSSLAVRLRNGDGTGLAEVFASAPDAPTYRHLWRELAHVEAALGDGAMRTLIFALPLVIVAGSDDNAGATSALPGTLADTRALQTILREHGALGGNQTFALANALVAADALEPARLPGLLALSVADADLVAGPRGPADLAPAPIPLVQGHESVHLRFIVGIALAAPGADLLASRGSGKWGIPLAQALAAQLAVPGASVLALPHAPQRLVPALQTGRALQREVSAQVFLSNALRKMRASTGEPSAVISAHRTPDAPSGGELRMSLSSPFAPRDAEGFRCPLYAADRLADVVHMLTTLLRDCRVTDVRTLAGVHADRDTATGAPLLFRADALH